MNAIIIARLGKLREKLAGDPVLYGQVSDFLDHGSWVEDDGTVTGSIVCGGVTRLLELDKTEMRLGRSGFPERKRIPMA